jgi:hypothetical protein
MVMSGNRPKALAENDLLTLAKVLDQARSWIFEQAA